ncbi:MAG: aldolase/citrate lyase family protein [Parvularculaceae bacterium]
MSKPNSDTVFGYGIFIKTPAPHLVEVAATSKLDFVVVDAEHAPFDRVTIDTMLLAGRAAGIPILVRVADCAASGILSALDLGARGVIVPHVDNAEIASLAVAAARFRDGKRGYSSGPRAAGYGTKPAAEILRQGDQTKVIVQIEHPDAVTNLEQILSVGGVDGILVGRADLALSMGYQDLRASEVDHVVDDVLRRANGKTEIVGLVLSSRADEKRYRQIGANFFLIGTDHGFLRAGVQHWFDGA